MVIGQHEGSQDILMIIEEAIGNLKVTLVDCSENEENLKMLEDRWILKMGTLFTGQNSHNEVLTLLLYRGGVFCPPTKKWQ